MPEMRGTALWAPRAWLADATGRGGWRERVLARIGADGCWSEIAAGVAQPPAEAQVVAGALLPGLVEQVGAAALVVAATSRFMLAFVAPELHGAVAAVSTVGWTLAFLSLAVRGLTAGR